ncbi:MAG: ABC transporter substrate-binding protein, partial [Oscillospiraceae bacterium]|nr:ABC transporter substrate-binding protein [Oscillospiraceae bacterium]
MIKKLISALLAAVMIASLCACGQAKAVPDVPYIIAGYSEPVKRENAYAECFTIYEYDNGDSMITTSDGGAYLITDSAPSGLAPDITVIPRSPDLIYLAASAVMCFYDSLGRLSDIRFSAVDTDGWYIENARSAMERGDIIYAGKYREPDYELLLSQGCRLSIQSTMSEHVPKVREKLEELGIPVFVDRSSY